MTTKRRKRHSPEQIVRKLRDADAMLNAGQDVAAVLQALEGERGHLSSLAEPVWGDEVGRGQAAEAVGGREPAFEGDRGGSAVGHQDAEVRCGGKLVSPSRKRVAVEQLQERFDVSERRACKVLDQPRSSQRYEVQPRDDEAALTKRMLSG